MAKGKLGNQAAFSTASNLMDALTIILMVMAGRFLGDADFGLLSYAQALALVVLGLGNFGLTAVTIRDVARDRGLAPTYFAVIAPWVGLLTLLALVGMVGYVAVSEPGDPRKLQVVALIGGATFFRLLVMLVRGFFQGLQRFELEAGAVFVENLVLIPVGVVLLLQGFGVVELAAGLLVSRFIGLLVHAGVLGRVVPLRARVDRATLQPLQLNALPIGMAQIVFMLIAQIDVLLIDAVLNDDAELGQFSAAFKLYYGTMLIPSIAVGVLMPRLSASMTGDKHTHNGLLLMGVGALAGICVVMIAIGYPLAGWGIALLYGESYGRAVPVMQIMLFATIPAFQIVMMRTYLVVIGRNKAYLTFSAIGLVVRVVLAVVLINAYGIRGAAMAICLSEALVVLAMWLFLFKVHFRPGPPGEAVGKLRLALATLSLRQ